MRSLSFDHGASLVSGRETRRAENFGSFFRRCPFNGGYLISAGLGEFLQWAEKWEVKAEDVAYLAGLKGATGQPLFKKEFLDYLKGQKLRVNMQAVPEGEIVFPNEPVLSVSGPNWQVDMAEAAFLNIFNAQSLIATKAARIVQAACADGVQRPVLEFGLRRAQDMGCFLPTRAAYIGGCAGTSNVAAARYYGIPPKGTMAHSFVMSYENELDAFKAYLHGAEGNTTLLIDTYDTREGAKMRFAPAGRPAFLWPEYELIPEIWLIGLMKSNGFLTRQACRRLNWWLPMIWMNI